MSLILMLSLCTANASSLTSFEQVTLFFPKLLVLSRKRKKVSVKIPYSILSCLIGDWEKEYTYIHNIYITSYLNYVKSETDSDRTMK